MKAIAGATGRSVQQIKTEAVAKGDLGIVAEVRHYFATTLIVTYYIHMYIHIILCTPVPSDQSQYTAYDVCSSSTDSTWSLLKAKRYCLYVWECCEPIIDLSSMYSIVMRC